MTNTKWTPLYLWRFLVSLWPLVCVFLWFLCMQMCLCNSFVSCGFSLALFLFLAWLFFLIQIFLFSFHLILWLFLRSLLVFFFFLFVLLSYIPIMATPPTSPPHPWLLSLPSEKSRPPIEGRKGCGPGRQGRWGGTERSRGGEWNHTMNILYLKKLSAIFRREKVCSCYSY